MKRKNMISMVTSLALVGVVAVGGTLALLASGPKSLTNTFTVGDGYSEGDFILQEHEVTQKGNGDYISTSDVTQTKVDYDNIVADSLLAKDPWFILKDASNNQTPPPASWIVAQITNVQNMKAAGIEFYAVAEKTNWRLVTATKSGDSWTYTLDGDALTVADLNAAVNDEDTKYYFVYMKQLNVDDETDKLFTQLKVAANISDNLNTSIDVKGVAVQAATAESALTDQEVLNDVMAAATAAGKLA